MLQEIAAFCGVALSAVKSLRLVRGNRGIIAKALGVLYRELSDLVVNGEKIMDMLSSHSSDRAIDWVELMHLLEDQHVIIRRINTTLGQRKVKTALSIHAPHLSPLSVLLEGKRLRIELLRQRIEPRYSEIVSPLWLERSGAPMLPDDSSIESSRLELRKIRAQAEELREFVVNNFKVDEVL